ncbi:MAG: cold shock domain-containing protein [Candidatus Marinimicrobia bacterium]|nr:cold shock domain-containing protein [Candidatus Neomarinimicrobiota bacterium]
MKQGTVKFFNSRKNYGFITGDDGNDYFVHSSGIAKGIYIKEGDRVSFDIIKGDRGPKAEKVDLID